MLVLIHGQLFILIQSAGKDCRQKIIIRILLEIIENNTDLIKIVQKLLFNYLI